jgi:protein TonB
MRVVVCGLVAACLVLAACSDAPERPRKAQVVKLLPDTPPPPPPPPKPEDRPPPKPDDAPKPVDQPKPVDAPQQQALKSDEAAGDGPGNGLTAGNVSRDYTNQALSQSQVIGSAAPVENPALRMAASVYANAATRALNDYLARDREIKRLDYQVRVDLWLGPSGGLERAELLGSSGDAGIDEALREALTRFPGAGVAPPARLPQPLRLRITNRMMG